MRVYPGIQLKAKTPSEVTPEVTRNVSGRDQNGANENRYATLAECEAACALVAIDKSSVLEQADKHTRGEDPRTLTDITDGALPFDILYTVDDSKGGKQRLTFELSPEQEALLPKEVSRFIRQVRTWLCGLRKCVARRTLSRGSRRLAAGAS